MNCISFIKLFVLLSLLSITLCKLENAEQITTFDKYMAEQSNFDQLKLFFFNDKECEKCSGLHPMLIEVSENLRDIIQLYEVQCHKIRRSMRDSSKEEIKQIPLCDEKSISQLPQIGIVTPPYTKINPYTHQPMKGSMSMYQGQANGGDIEEEVKKKLPVYRTKIENKNILKSFLNFKKLPIKLLLFTNKKETPLMLKGLSAIFRDRIDFGEVQDTQQDILEEYSVTDFPTLLLLTWNEKEDKYEQEIYHEDLTFDDVKNWLSGYALPDKVERDEPQEEEKKQEKKQDKKQKPQQESERIPSFRMKNYDKKILEEEKMVLMHIFRRNEENETSMSQIAQKFGKMIQIYNFEISSEDREKFALETFNVKKFPILKLFPFGTQKKANCRLFFPIDIDVKEFIADVSELILDNSVSISSDQELQMFVASAFQEEKLPILFFHNNENTPISFRALTYLTKYTDKMKFINVKNPTEFMKQNFQIQKLPGMSVLFKVDEEEDPKQTSDKKKDKQGTSIKMAQYRGKIQFDDMSSFLDQVTNQDQPQTPTKKKKLTEIVDQDGFETACPSSSAICFIALFNQEDKEQFEQKFEIFDEVAQSFSGRPLKFMWIDGVCHNYLLPKLNINEDDLPQLIFYSPSKKNFVNQIGTFSYDSLNLFISKAAKGQVSFNNLDDELEIEEQDCTLMYEKRKQIKAEKSISNNEEEDEILKEILEEERQKKLELERELQAQKQSKKKDKKKKKKKSKDKKEGDKEDL